MLPTYLAEKLFFGSTWGFSLKLALSAKQHLLETIVTLSLFVCLFVFFVITLNSKCQDITKCSSWDAV